MQPVGCNQTAHYSLIQSLSDHTPHIDRYSDQTCDTAYVDGHYFAAKAPGLALATLPWYVVLHAVGAIPVNPDLHGGFPAAMLSLPRRALWEVGLVGTVLPALLLLVLIGTVAERIAPGSGLPTAAFAGLGTLIFPFATVLFSHVLATTLAFAGFALLFSRRDPLLAGVAAGLAVVVDFPLALVTLALAVYAWPRTPRFAAGAILGMLPAAAFNQWAFHDPFRLSYANAVLVPGKSGHEVLGANTSGFFGIGVPSLRAGTELLLSPRGLFILSPILLVGAAGLLLNWRRGLRREAVLCASLAVAYLVYNAGYYVPFGGYVPGPRFLIPIIPFLLLGLPVAISTWPATTLVLGGVSIGAMTVATAAEPLLGNDDTHSWVTRWENGDFAQSVLTLVGQGHGWLAVTPFLLAVAVAVVAAFSQLPRPRLTARAVAALVGWLICFKAAPALLHTDRAVHQAFGLVTVVALVVIALAMLVRLEGVALLLGAPLLLLAIPGVAAHTKESLALVLTAGTIFIAVEIYRSRGIRLRESA